MIFIILSLFAVLIITILVVLLSMQSAAIKTEKSKDNTKKDNN